MFSIRGNQSLANTIHVHKDTWLLDWHGGWACWCIRSHHHCSDDGETDKQEHGHPTNRFFDHPFKTHVFRRSVPFQKHLWLEFIRRTRVNVTRGTLQRSFAFCTSLRSVESIVLDKKSVPVCTQSAVLLLQGHDVLLTLVTRSLGWLTIFKFLDECSFFFA